MKESFGASTVFLNGSGWFEPPNVLKLGLLATLEDPNGFPLGLLLENGCDLTLSLPRVLYYV